MDIVFIINSLLLGAGLAMDAFSVSIVNGMNEPRMKRGRMCLIAGTYAGFQFLMPVIGWFCVHTIASYFRAVEPWIPWIALILLLWIGGSMILEGIRGGKEKEEIEEAQEKPAARVGAGLLLAQGVATSIDALSVGFTIADYRAGAALACALIIAGVTFVICLCGLLFGKRFGERLADRAQVVGGLILIGIGVEIVLRSILG